MAVDQIIVLLDVDGPVDLHAVRDRVPGPVGDRAEFRLTDLGWDRVPRAQIHWPSLGSAIRRLGDRVAASLPADGRRAVIYVAGLAPLPVFVALGSRLDPRRAEVHAINQRKNEPGVWDVVSLMGSADGERLLRFPDNVLP
jgi:hypothetical protein